MQPARIRKFEKTATDLLATNNYEAAFVLRWIAYEGLVRRAAIKALWMRGALVGEAQKIINQLQGPEWEDPTTLLAKCCHTYINIERGDVPVFKALRDRMHIRNLLFHQLEVATKKSQFDLVSDLLGRALADPSVVFGDIKVDVAPGKMLRRLGNPLVDLRKAEREKSIPRKSVQALLGYDAGKLSPVPKVDDLTDDIVRSLFDPAPATGKTPQFVSEKNRTFVVERKRPPLSKTELQNRLAALRAFAPLKTPTPT